MHLASHDLSHFVPIALNSFLDLAYSEYSCLISSRPVIVVVMEVVCAVDVRTDIHQRPSMRSLSVNSLLDHRDTVLGEAESIFEQHLSNLSPHDMMLSKMPESLAEASRADNLL